MLQKYLIAALGASLLSLNFHVRAENSLPGVSGVVYDENGDPVAGATVAVAGSDTGAVVTDIQGRFDIADAPAGSRLEINYVGMKPSVTEIVKGKSSYSVVVAWKSLTT